MKKSPAETQARCHVVLADWMRLGGHAESEIRRLAKQEAMPIKPPPEKKKGR